MSILQQIQSELKSPKDLRNDFGKYQYRSMEGINEAIKPILTKHNASLVLSDEMVEVGGRVYVKATATLYDESMKVVITNTAYAREAENKKGMDDAQITGAASSYARKYACNGLFCIDETKDADATNKHDKDDSNKTSGDFEIELDKHCATLNSLGKAWPRISKKAKAALPDIEFAKFVQYKDGIKKILQKTEDNKHVPGELPGDRPEDRKQTDPVF